MNFSSVLLIMGVIMLGYDAIGHGCCAIAHLTGNLGANLWNKYSQCIWPSIANQIHYHLFWMIWHSVTISLFVLAYKLKIQKSP